MESSALRLETLKQTKMQVTRNMFDVLSQATVFQLFTGLRNNSGRSVINILISADEILSEASSTSRG